MAYLMFVLKLILSFSLTLVLLSSFGYRNLSPTSPTDQIYNYVLGGIIGGALLNESITIYHIVIIFLSWGLLMKALDYIKTRVKRIRILIDGQPLVLYDEGRFNKANMKRSNLSLHDLTRKMRSQGLLNMNEVKYLEILKNGQLLSIRKDDTAYGYILVADGMLNEHELKKAGITESDLKAKLLVEGITDYRSIYYCEYSQNKLIIK